MALSIPHRPYPLLHIHLHPYLVTPPLKQGRSIKHRVIDSNCFASPSLACLSLRPPLPSYPPHPSSLSTSFPVANTSLADFIFLARLDSDPIHPILSPPPHPHLARNQGRLSLPWESPKQARLQQVLWRARARGAPHPHFTEAWQAVRRQKPTRLFFSAKTIRKVLTFPPTRRSESGM
ncbi:uncharacterized protein LY79DRAFT_542290 [Colletotrichum navitas]|uniref:Uncharacterized protein n=1 Tax=Colletotrichum navitas TaxID=681940 RepID=A0AAD8Q782_9PEZI|nr:uncharacterized protein LY79DRAFT_542290 [Colletotrichum navitas]KAK1597135.1 hypothetical protein LY79DRAFT_542290 [Colletotrichum navitas]